MHLVVQERGGQSLCCWWWCWPGCCGSWRVQAQGGGGTSFGGDHIESVRRARVDSNEQEILESPAAAAVPLRTGLSYSAVVSEEREASPSTGGNTSDRVKVTPENLLPVLRRE